MLLRGRVFMLVSIILTLCMFLITIIIIYNVKTAMLDEAKLRAKLIAENFTHNCRDSMLIEDIETLSAALKAVLETEDVISGYIYNSHDHLIASRAAKPNTPMDKNTIVPRPAEFMITEKPDKANPLIINLDIQNPVFGGEKKYIGSVRLGVSLNRIQTKIEGITTDAASILLLFILLAFAISYIFSLSLTRPIYRLVEGIEKISQGDLSTRVAIKRHDEIGKLAKSFNAMTVSLSATYVSKQYLDKVVNLMFDGLIVVDLTGIITMVNQTALDILGYTRDELLGRPLATILPPQYSSIKDISDIQRTQISWWTKQGKKLSAVLSVTKLIDEQKNIEGIICIFQKSEAKPAA